MFHVLPLTLLIPVFLRLKVFARRETAVRASMLIAATAEPLYQVLALRQTGLTGLAEALLVGLHILCISLFLLWIFRRHGFLHMYLFRLLYYMIWHIAWGYLRLQV